MSTSSTAAQLKTVVARLLAYTSPTGATLKTMVGGRIYRRRPAADAAFPHVVINKQGATTDREVSNLRETFELEVTVYSRERTQEPDADDIADVIEQALLSWRESSPTLGFTSPTGARRDAIGPFSTPANPLSPADPEVTTVRLMFDCISWPVYLTSAL